MSTKVSTTKFVKAWEQAQGSPAKVAALLGMDIRGVYARRSRLAETGVVLPSVPSTEIARRSSKRFSWSTEHVAWERRRSFEIDGPVVVFSDPHFYPGDRSVAYYALLEVIKDLKPKMVICGGDALDGTQISRHDPTRGFHMPPPLAEQLQAMVEQMNEIEKVAKGAVLAWTLGNHDARLSRFLAVRAPEVENLPGTTLEDYCPRWPLSWSVELNGNTLVRHRPISGGSHSTYASPLRAGCHFVHGHLHNLNVRRVPRYGISGPEFHFGVDAGSLADYRSDAFDYMEDGLPFTQGFAVLTYRKQELVGADVCEVQRGTAWFRGEAVA